MTSAAPAIALLERLVAFETVSARSNRDLIDWAAGVLRDAGIEATVLPSPDGGKANLFATIGPAAPGGVVLSGHTDVVPAEGQAWSSAPFTLTERGGRLHGRGTADMKGFLALCLAGAPGWARRGLRRPIHLAFSYDEEVGCLGAPDLIAHLRRNVPPPALAIIGEPTMMRPVGAHKGIDAFRTTVTGHPAHSSAPQRGANAITAAVRIIDYITKEAASRRAAPILGSPFDPPCTTFNVGRIRGGSALNIVAGDCCFDWEFRTHPGDDPEAVFGRVARFIGEAVLPELRAHPGTGVETVRLASAPMLRPEPDGAAAALARRLTGAADIGTVAFVTEGGLYQAAGLSTVVCGPGDIAQAHQADEFISRDQLDAGARFLDGVAEWAAA